MQTNSPIVMDKKGSAQSVTQSVKPGGYNASFFVFLRPPGYYSPNIQLGSSPALRMMVLPALISAVQRRGRSCWYFLEERACKDGRNALLERRWWGNEKTWWHVSVACLGGLHCRWALLMACPCADTARALALLRSVPTGQHVVRGSIIVASLPRATTSSS